MEVTNIESGKQTIVSTFITDNAGVGIPALSPTFVLKCLGPDTSAHYNMFYDFVNDIWSSTPVENTIPEVSGVSGAYIFQFDKDDIGVNDTEYLVRIATTVGVSETQATIFRYASIVEKSVANILSIVSPTREEMHRVTNDTMELRYFNEDNVEVSRFLVSHDSSGNQPEQTKEKVS